MSERNRENKTEEKKKTTIELNVARCRLCWGWKILKTMLTKLEYNAQRKNNRERGERSTQ